MRSYAHITTLQSFFPAGTDLRVRRAASFQNITHLEHRVESSTLIDTRLTAFAPSPKMTVTLQPEVALSPLPKADGSTIYSHAGYSITASANGPVEAPKRDEHPYEALVDVVVRPASGVGGEHCLSCPHFNGPLAHKRRTRY